MNLFKLFSFQIIPTGIAGYSNHDRSPNLHEVPF